MYRKTVVCLILVFGFHLRAQTIALNGRVTNQRDKTISGAVVTLDAIKLTDTTDADGVYSLSGEIATVKNVPMVPGLDALSLKNGSIVLHLTKPNQVRIERFDMQGNLLERVLETCTMPGNYRFDPIKHRHAVNMVVIRISIGHYTSSFHSLPFVNGNGAVTASLITTSTTGNVSTGLQAVVDSLYVSALGYQTQKVPITSYEGTVDITLTMEDRGECTPSEKANATTSGSGPHDVVIETNSDPGIKKGTIFRPADLGGDEKYPIFVWGNGGCSQNGLFNTEAKGEIASWGYFVISDGTPGGSGMGKHRGNTMSGMGNPQALYDYISWAIAENRKPCSAYYRSLDTTKIAADGYSCGGLMAINASADPRFTAIGYTSSGLFSADKNIWKGIHTPFKILNGGSKDMAYENGLRDYDGISALGIPIIYFSKTSAGHGGDLKNGTRDFNTINVAWLNWQLKGDKGATGKALLIGPDCKYCNDRGWEFKSANID